MKKRPIGLTVFAVINFIFGGFCLLGLFVTMVLWPGLRQQAGLSLSYSIVSPLLTATFLIISGIGFLKLSYRTGFVCGVVFCVLSLVNILVFNALRGFQGFLIHIPSMVYPTLLFLMLTLKYKRVFQMNTEATEQGIEGNAEDSTP